jgi:hypothetical protein
MHAHKPANYPVTYSTHCASTVRYVAPAPQGCGGAATLVLGTLVVGAAMCAVVAWCPWLVVLAMCVGLAMCMVGAAAVGYSAGLQRLVQGKGRVQCSYVHPLLGTKAPATVAYRVVR